VADNQHVSIGYLRHLASIAPHPADRQHFALVADLIEAQHAEIERLRAEVERLTQLHERIAASDDVAKAYQQVYFEDFPTVKQAVAETLLAKEQLAAERAEIERLRKHVNLRTDATTPICSGERDKEVCRG
jgi:hypothetical protein